MAKNRVSQNANWKRAILSGFQGIQAGGNGSILLTPNRRVAKVVFYVAAIAYTAPVVVLPALGGTAPVLTPVVQAGVITSVAITNAGTGLTNGSYTNVKVTDPTGADYSANLTITVAGAIVTAVTVVSGGVVSPCPADVFFTATNPILQTVSDSNIRDITAAQILKINYDMLVPDSIGRLTLNYVAPPRKISVVEETTIWDLWGEKSLQYTFNINGNISSPSITGYYDFDDDVVLRRTIQTTDASGKPVVKYVKTFVAQHATQAVIPANQSLFGVTTVPFGNPITRFFVEAATPADFTQLEIHVDGVIEVQLWSRTAMSDYQSDFGFAEPSKFAARTIFDFDERLNRRIKPTTSLELKFTSASTQTVNIVRESTQHTANA